MELKKIKLNKLSEEAPAQHQLQGIKGGKCCLRACAYANQGGSSTHDNKTANLQHGYASKKLNPNNECDFEVMR
ncbi:TIGR04149 family rSAM-modified RiPP [uncultured Porphyromonas sp.]|uniref:TIGR04149 family rSAM-modified RiPP n=1 Tax=uncultured Porphyromonas sp. TaxID=159274 RepID=UPI003455E720